MLFRLGRCSIKKHAVAGVFFHRPLELKTIFFLPECPAHFYSRAMCQIALCVALWHTLYYGNVDE